MFKTKSSQIVLLFMICLTGLLVARDILGLSLNKFVFVFIVLAFALLLKSEDLATIICFMFPLTWGLPYTYIFLGTIILYWIKRKRIPALSLFLTAFFLLLEISASFFYPSVDYPRILKYLSVLSIFFTFLYDSEVDRERCIMAYYLGTIVLCFVILISTFKNAPSNWLYLFSRGWFRFGSKQAENVDGMMLSVNANTLAYYSIVGSTLSFGFLPKSEGKERLFHILALVLFVLSGVFTVSISWMVVMTGCTLLFVFTQTKRVKAVLSTGICILLLVVFARAMLSRTPELLAAFVSRLSKADLATGHARTDLMIEYHNLFWSNVRFILMGTGVTQYRQVTITLSNSFHNMIQQIFVSYGIIAGIVYFVAFLSPLRKIEKHTTTLLDWIPLIGVISFTQTIQFINPESLMLPYVIAFYFVSVRSMEKKRNETLYYNG